LTIRFGIANASRQPSNIQTQKVTTPAAMLCV